MGVKYWRSSAGQGRRRVWHVVRSSVQTLPAMEGYWERITTECGYIIYDQSTPEPVEGDICKACARSAGYRLSKRQALQEGAQL